MTDKTADFFKGYEESKRLFDQVLRVVEEIGVYEMRVTKSQVVLRRRRPFAWLWIPARYLRGRTAPLVLSLNFPQPDPSTRWKEIVEAAPGRVMHHLELFLREDIDAQVLDWPQTAWEAVK